ncbi:MULTISPECIES: DUF1266 domain-containing protein [Enterobacterales]|uniref:DUF1266 domain-containing protein n=1 Tax=Enterobacterales TaxID=91347 RepID=UPI002ED78FBD
MDAESQLLLFALSTPMEILNQDCSPSHSSPRMYLDIPFFDVSESWGINTRDELIQMIYRMTDNGHACDLDAFYSLWFRLSPGEWQRYTSELNNEGRAYAQFVAETAAICGEAGIKAWDYVRMGFLCRIGVLNKWLTEEESLWLQSRLYVRAIHFYHSWMHYFAAYSLGRLYWQCPGDPYGQLTEALTRKKYDQASDRMFNELIAGIEGFYIELPWKALKAYPACPQTLRGVSDL